MIRSAAEPESVLIELALMVPDVRPSRALMMEAARFVSLSVTSSLPRPEMEPLPLAV